MIVPFCSILSIIWFLLFWGPGSPLLDAKCQFSLCFIRFFDILVGPGARFLEYPKYRIPSKPPKPKVGENSLQGIPN